MISLLRSVGVLVLVVAAACGDDGVHHLADAPGAPDVPVDMPVDVPTDAAIDAPPNLDLTVTLSGNGGGRVTSSVGGIDCGATCAQNYPPNTTVTLTAQPAVGSVFAGWMGGCTGTSPTCDVTLAQATTVTATFTLQTFTVTVGKVGVGTGTVMGSGINCGSTCTTTVNYGTAITLTAAPLALSNFIGWSAPCTGTGACTTTITANTTITAAFALDDISMTVTKSGNGSGTVTSAPAGINCGVDCDQIYVANTMVTLTAAPATGSTFSGWSGAGCTGTGTCAVTMTTAVLVTATFTLDTFQLDVARSGNGTGTVTSAPAGIACGGDCNEIYDYNTMVTLTAAPGTGSTFTGWSGGGCTGTGTCVVTVTAATSVTATFTLNMHLLTVALAGTGSGAVTSTPAGITCGVDCNQLYNHGTMVSLAAAPSVGSTFTGWSGACTGTGACMVTMTAAASVTATFTIKSYALTVALAGNGAGSVASSPAGITCGADCTEVYTHGTVVMLTPTAMVGSTFAGWSGACTGTGACAVTMTAVSAVTATFTLNTFALTVAKAGTGSGTVTSTPAGISCGADCSEIYNFGQMVMLAQAATTGSTFTGWSGACTGTGACIVTLDAAKSVTATFTLDTLTLTVMTAGTGAGSVTSTPAGISCGADCSEIYNFGQMVTLSQSASTGSTFAGWSGACTGSGTCTVTMDAAKSVTATFTLNTYALTVTPAGTGAGTVTSTPVGINCGIDCSEIYGHGTVVTLAQTASTGSTFAGWSGACSGTGACVVTMDAVKSVTATFTLNTYMLSVTKPGTGAGTVTSTPAGISCGADCSEVYSHGLVITLSQTATTGSTFTGWGGACSGTGTCTVTMNAVKSVTATFTLNTYTLTANPVGNGTITSSPAGISCGVDCTEIYNHGTIVTLSQSAGIGSTFTGWSGACTGTGACMVTMDMAKSVTATFTLNTYALTVNALGTGSGTVTSTPAGISCGVDCTEVYNHGTVVTLSQTAATGSVFAGWGGGVCSGTGACTVTMDMAGTVTATFNLATYTLTVTNASSAGGAGTISSTAAGISCGADCTEVYNYGTVVTLTASPGTASNFIGWSACAGLGACTITITADTSVTGTFSAPNVMFVTAGTYRGAFAVNAASGANAYADSQCQTLAAAAGLVGNAPGQDPEFRAWLSSGNAAGLIVNAVSRFTGSSGWIRAGDWLPVMNSTTDLASSKIWYPPRRTQDGVDLGADAQLWTGTDTNGMYTGVACVNGNAWTTGNTQILATIGLSSATGSPITQFVDSSCGTSRRLLCMGVGRNTTVGAPPAGGKLAFTTGGTWTPNANGITSADNVCIDEAAAANLPGTYKALLTPQGTYAIRRFNSTGRPWVRIGDRQRITTFEATMFSANTTVLDVAPNADASGNRIGNVSIYTGAPTVTTLGDAQGTCGDWRNPGEFKGTAGFPFDTGMQNYFFGAQNNNAPCNVPRHLVCLQE